MMGSSTMWDIPEKYRSIIKEQVNILGINISTNKKKTIENNYNLIKDKIEETIWKWNRITSA